MVAPLHHVNKYKYIGFDLRTLANFSYICFEMARSSSKVLKSLTDQVNKSPFLFNASTAIGNATERAHMKISGIQNVAFEKYNNIVKNVNGSTIIQDLKTASLKPVKPLPKLLVNYWQWYQQLTGLDKVEISKQQVIIVQDKIFKCQDHRQLLMRQSSSLNDKLKEIYSELIQTRRDDPKYVQLTILENKSLQEQSGITNELTLLEGKERDYFTQLATAIKEYHDSQTMNAQKFKYLSITASAIFAIISLTGSAIYNNKRILDVRKIISESQISVEKNLMNNLNMMNKLNEQFSAISNITKTQKEQKNVGDMEQLKQTGYYVGIAVFTLYILQQIFRS